MINVRDGFKECVGFSMEDVEVIIEDICLNLNFLFFKTYTISKLLYVSF